MKNIFKNKILINFKLKLFIGLILSFLIVFLLIPYFIYVSKKINIKQKVRKKFLKKHTYKENTHTMGGIIIFISILLSNIFLFNINKYTLHSILIYITYMIIGFTDDYIKIKNNSYIGLSIKKKIFIQIFFTTIINTLINIIKKKILLSKKYCIKRITNILIQNIIILSTSNSVNLTDGIDGLAITTIILIISGLLLISIINGNIFLSKYFNTNYLFYSKKISILCSTILGSCLGFLWYNSYPSEIFMGDTGSLSLGSLIGIIFITLKTKLLLIIMGFILIIESLSVIIQILSYKLYKKKLLLISPIHHHYELKGLHENKVSLRLTLISMLSLIISILLFY